MFDAALASGLLMGFLFGIPRSVQLGAPPNGTWAHTYVYSEDGSVFHGLVLERSLQAVDS